MILSKRFLLTDNLQQKSLKRAKDLIDKSLEIQPINAEALCQTAALHLVDHNMYPREQVLFNLELALKLEERVEGFLLMQRMSEQQKAGNNNSNEEGIVYGLQALDLFLKNGGNEDIDLGAIRSSGY